MTSSSARSFRIGASLFAFSCLSVSACTLEGGSGLKGKNTAQSATPDGSVSRVGTPQILQLAYYAGTATRGPHMLFSGSDGDGLMAVNIEMFDATGAPVAVDGVTSFAYDTGVVHDDGSFFVEVNSVPGFDSEVRAIAATPVGSANDLGGRKMTSLSNPPVRTTGEACDARFDVCDSADVCFPGTAGTPNTCTNASELRKSSCSQAPFVDVSELPIVITGHVDSVSLWDPIAGCTSPDSVGLPEGLVMINVPTTLASLTLSTANAATNFDTVLSMVPGCTDDNTSTVACNDDDPAPTSRLVLQDVTPGTYSIRIDSHHATSDGNFALTVTSP